jgi:hypothetical protein
MPDFSDTMAHRLHALRNHLDTLRTIGKPEPVEDALVRVVGELEIILTDVANEIVIIEGRLDLVEGAR